MSDTAHGILITRATASPPRVRDYIDLLKPRVMSLVVFAGLVGVLIAPGHAHPFAAALAVLAIALGSGAAGAINMWYERDLDALMTRTANRPLPAGRVARERARGGAGRAAVDLLHPADGGRDQLRRRGAAGGGDPVLCFHLHDLAEAPDAAEHRDSRRGRRL